MAIGAVVPTLDSAVFSHALQSMQTALSRQGYQLLIASHDYNSAAETEAIRMLLTRGVDGLMLVGAQRAEIDLGSTPHIWRSDNCHMVQH